jgi:hypothetical protein
MATESAKQTLDGSEFLQRFRGRFLGIRQWEDLDQLWQCIKSTGAQSWYIYHVGDPLPAEPVDSAMLTRFIDEIDVLLRAEHEHDYCGIVYVDDPQAPTFVKIFDPSNLGVSCGFSDNPPLPGWVLSHIPPVDLPSAFPPPGNRRRWYQRLFAR